MAMFNSYVTNYQRVDFRKQGSFNLEMSQFLIQLEQVAIPPTIFIWGFHPPDNMRLTHPEDL